MQLLRDYEYKITEQKLVIRHDKLTGKKEYYSQYWKQYLNENQFTSEHYFCVDCLRKFEFLSKGHVRYDSLVLCLEHNTMFEPVINKLRKVLDDVPHVTYH